MFFSKEMDPNFGGRTPNQPWASSNGGGGGPLMTHASGVNLGNRFRPDPASWEPEGRVPKPFPTNDYDNAPQPEGRTPKERPFEDLRNRLGNEGLPPTAINIQRNPWMQPTPWMHPGSQQNWGVPFQNYNTGIVPPGMRTGGFNMQYGPGQAVGGFYQNPMGMRLAGFQRANENGMMPFQWGRY